MRWTREQYEDYVARSSSRSKPKQVVCHEPVAAPAREDSHSTRYAVSVTSRRRRLIDPDNLCPKYFIDGLRYAGIIHDDTSKEITVEVKQEKVSTKEQEETVITVEKLIHAN